MFYVLEIGIGIVTEVATVIAAQEIETAGRWILNFVNTGTNDGIHTINRDREKQSKRNYSPVQNSNDFDDNYDSDNNQEFFYQQKPNNKIIVRGLAAHITEADVSNFSKSV